MSLLVSLVSTTAGVNTLRPLDMFVWGFGDDNYHVLREEHLVGGKGYSIRIPPEPELCAEFLPSDKSSQQVTAEKEGRQRDERIGGERRGTLTQSCLRGTECFVKDGLFCKGHFSVCLTQSHFKKMLTQFSKNIVFDILPCYISTHILCEYVEAGSFCGGLSSIRIV